MTEIKSIDFSKFANDFSNTTVNLVNSTNAKITNAIETKANNTDVDTININPTNTTFNEENTTNDNNIDKNTPKHSTNLLREKLIGTSGMGSYGIAKGIIEANPMIPATISLTECIIESKITSKPTSTIVNKGFQTVNTAFFPEQWTKYGEDAFIKTEQSFITPGKMFESNINVARYGGARLNVGINAAFAAMDGKKVWDHYEENGEKGSDHMGEITGRFVGEAAGGAGGFAAGMALGTTASAAITGAVCGSVVPGVGTAVGLLTGAVIGAIATVALGDAGATIGSYVDGMNGEIVTL